MRLGDIRRPALDVELFKNPGRWQHESEVINHLRRDKVRLSDSVGNLTIRVKWRQFSRASRRVWSCSCILIYAEGSLLRSSAFTAANSL